MKRSSKTTPAVFRGYLPHLNQIYQLENKIFRKSDRFSKRRFKYLLSSENVAFFLGMDGETSVGYGIAMKNRLRNGQTKGRVYSIGVLSKYRGKGVGTLLFTRMEDWLVRSQVSFITLETRKGSSGAAEFFEKFGYHVTELLPKYYEGADGLRMRKSDGRRRVLDGRRAS